MIPDPEDYDRMWYHDTGKSFSKVHVQLDNSKTKENVYLLEYDDLNFDGGVKGKTLLKHGQGERLITCVGRYLVLASEAQLGQLPTQVRPYQPEGKLICIKIQDELKTKVIPPQPFIPPPDIPEEPPPPDPPSVPEDPNDPNKKICPEG